MLITGAPVLPTPECAAIRPAKFRNPAAVSHLEIGCETGAQSNSGGLIWPPSRENVLPSHSPVNCYRLTALPVPEWWNW